MAPVLLESPVVRPERRGTERRAATRLARALPLAALAAVLVAGFLIRAPLIDYNLPVAAHVDERNSVDLLLHLKRESLDPGFFNYPTLYFYLTWLVVRPLESVEEILRAGRALNLVLACGAGLAAYGLGALALRSRWTGVGAAALTVFSPILVNSASYIITDVLFAALVTAGLAAMGCFFARGGYRAWVVGIACFGLATATKYNAAVAVAAYLLAEFLCPPVAVDASAPSRWRAWLEGRWRRGTLTVLALGAGALALATGLFFPESYLLGLVESGQGLNSSVDSSDLRFLEGMRRKAWVAGVAATLFGGLCLLRPRLERRLSLRRPFAGGALAVAVFLACSPFVALSFRQFLFDFGYELKMNAAGVEAYWARYPRWFAALESPVVAVLAAVGAATCWRTRRRETVVALLYLGLFYVLIGSATRGFQRYLTPMLPVLFVFSAHGLVAGTRQLRRVGGGGVAAMFACGAVVVVALGQHPRVAEVTARAGTRDEMFGSYRATLAALGDGTVYYAGHVPYLELRERGVRVHELPYARLSEGGLEELLGTGDLLLVDRRALGRMSEPNRGELVELYADPSGWGQALFAPRPRP